MKKQLFEQTNIAGMTLKNRLWRSATWLNMADDKGHITKKLLDSYIGLASGGVSTIITGYAFILEDEQPNPGMLGIYNDDFIEEYQGFVAKLKEHGANVVMQIVYGGSTTKYNTEDRVIWGPSAVAHPSFGTVPVEMSKDDIETVIEAYVNAARRVKAAGFDGVQLHGAHSYLFSQFLTPYYNQRSDEYGGSIENRGRIIFETVKRVRAAVGESYPVFIKMHCSDEWDENGLSVEDSLYVAKELERLGITGIEFSGGNMDIENYPGKAPIKKGLIKEEKQSYFAEKTAIIAKELNIPVISVGGHRSPQKMEDILNSTDISYFSLSRTLHAEPDLINRWRDGNFDKPRCTSCAQCWHSEGNVCILDRNKK